VKLLEIVERDGHCFIVTKLCEGETLRELIQRRRRLT
jgi:serine/threonine protein kinase